MSDDDARREREDAARREREEAERLQREIDRLRNQIYDTDRQNQILEQEIVHSLRNIEVLIMNAAEMDSAVTREIHGLMETVDTADVSTCEVFKALEALTVQYFTFKHISTASKNMTQYTDEYSRKYHYYNDLRRITLGYVIGLDTNIISNEVLRKKVEKAYLQNTEYWLAYSIASVMLWASGEKEAAERALSKSMSINYGNASLFYLLVNLRFNRIEAAKKWYLGYLKNADMSNLGDEWQYLLQAYLSGAFGIDQDFEGIVMESFKNMMFQIDLTHADFGNKATEKSRKFAEAFLNSTSTDYLTLMETCKDYKEIMALLNNSGKNTLIARFFELIYEDDENGESHLFQRIENVLYGIISDYDEDEKEIIRKINYNEAIIGAKGDLQEAQRHYDEQFSHENKQKNFADLLIHWAFAESVSQTSNEVKRFSIAMMKEWILKGFQQFCEKYRRDERQKYQFTIDDFNFQCSEDDFITVKPKLEEHYSKNKHKLYLADKHFQIYTALCLLSLIMLGFMAVAFSKEVITIAVLLGIGASFLLWRRIVELGKAIQEQKRLGVLKLKRTLEELGQWRKEYRENDSGFTALESALERF